MSDKDRFRIQWFHSLQFRVVAGAVAVFLSMLVAILVISRTVGEDLIRQHAYQKVTDAGFHVELELEKRTTLAITTVRAVAAVAARNFENGTQAMEIIHDLYDLPGATRFIVGGGVWPEPYAFDPTRKRSSVFWSRDASGELAFFDNYNSPEGKGYHAEEWYAPVRHIAPGEYYWSRSYIDPYAFQPMVTVSTPIYRSGAFAGVATVDLRLDGLRELLMEATAEFGGYAFLVGRNGRFLSFPEDNLAKVTSDTNASGSLVPYILMSELAEHVKEYARIDTLLAEQSNRYAARNQVNRETDRLASKISEESYQIPLDEARVIAASIVTDEPSAPPSTASDQIQATISLEQDYLLGEPAYVSSTLLPATLWQIVTVIPRSAARADAVMLFNRFLTIVLIAVFTAIALFWLLIRAQLTRPIASLSRQLSLKLHQGNSESELISTADKGELGVLTHWFNRRTSQLLQSQRQVEQLAFFDALTGLPNRRMLHERLSDLLELAKRSVCQGAVLFLDLDQFKNINDSLGHSVGDQILQEIADRLRNTLREQDLIARVGGDEFVIVLVYENEGETRIVQHATDVAKKVIDLLSKPLGTGENEYYITASIGICLFSNDVDEVETILKQADTAMYQAKEDGRNTFSFFELAMQEKVDHRLRIEKELRSALEENAFRVLYQPQIDREGCCRAAEALLRWDHPVHGLLSPDQFIPIAEESSLIHSIGRWVIRDVCRQIKEWREKGIIFDHIAVNVSPRQFEQGDVVGTLKAAIAEFGISPRTIMLEITEGVIFQHTEDTIAKMTELKNLGIKISVDDFGTGYSSLLYLKILPISQLKIDKSFVADLVDDENDLVIVEAVLSMARHLGLDVIAEGVETEEQYLLLRNRGCHFFQGFYFSKPIRPEEAECCLSGDPCCNHEVPRVNCPIDCQFGNGF